MVTHSFLETSLCMPPTTVIRTDPFNFAMVVRIAIVAWSTNSYFGGCRGCTNHCEAHFICCCFRPKVTLCILLLLLLLLLLFWYRCWDYILSGYSAGHPHIYSIAASMPSDLSRATILLSHSKYDRHWTGPNLIINWHNSYLFLPKNEVKHFYYYFICFNSDIALSFLIFSLSLVFVFMYNVSGMYILYTRRNSVRDTIIILIDSNYFQLIFYNRMYSMFFLNFKVTLMAKLPEKWRLETFLPTYCVKLSWVEFSCIKIGPKIVGLSQSVRLNKHIFFTEVIVTWKCVRVNIFHCLKHCYWQADLEKQQSWVR